MGRPWILSLISLAICIFGTHAIPEPQFDSAHYHPDDIITRDVLIIGGGSSGTYSAFQLRDKAKSVVVVEKKDLLGGHTETYTDPATHIPDNLGVIVFHNFDVVQKYFARFNVPLRGLDFGAFLRTITYADFRTGKVVQGYTPPNPAQALAGYAAQLAKYPYLETGFDLPDPVPADLLIPFGDFVAKYQLGDAVPTIFNPAQGYGDILKLPTLYVLKVFSNAVLNDTLTGGYVTAARGDNHELYDKALQELGSDALLRSTVVAIKRNPHGNYAKAIVQTPTGKKLIRAKNILITIPPLLSNLQNFDLDHHERSLFTQFSYKGYYTGLLRNTGIPPSLSIVNIGADTPYHLLAFPGLYDVSPAVIPGAFDVKYASETAPDSDHVKADILASLHRLRANGAFNLPSNSTPPFNATTTTTPSNSTNTNVIAADGADFAFFSAHVPFNLHVPASSIENGFYRDLYALQGRKRFWYSGAAFHTHDSTLLWTFSKGIAERIASA